MYTELVRSLTIKHVSVIWSLSSRENASARAQTGRKPISEKKNIRTRISIWWVKYDIPSWKTKVLLLPLTIADVNITINSKNRKSDTDLVVKETENRKRKSRVRRRKKKTTENERRKTDDGVSLTRSCLLVWNSLECYFCCDFQSIFFSVWFPSTK